MGTTLDQIKARFKQAPPHLKLVYANLAAFAVVAAVRIALLLFNVPVTPLLHALELPASFQSLAWQPWSAFTYMWLHADPMHLLFNMLWLYWFGRLFLDLFQPRQLLGVYVLGGLGGGLLYMLTYHLFPYFQGMIDYSRLLGASASVLAIVAATAYRTPDYRIRLMFLGDIRIKHLALAVLVIDLLFITSDNAGGHIAHLGGAMTGVGIAWLMRRGTDLTRWTEWLHPANKSRTKSARPKFHPEQRVEINDPGKEWQDHIDRILEKVRKSGYQSLSEDEKKDLFRASNRP